jgi:undecaprenyl-diphosphatase
MRCVFYFVNDFAFEKATEKNTLQTRHHVRFWKTKYITKGGDTIYVGSASFDTGIKWGITHRISPDIDSERDFLYNDLVRTGRVQSASKINLARPQAGRNFTGDLFFTNGQAYIITLK